MSFDAMTATSPERSTPDREHLLPDGTGRVFSTKKAASASFEFLPALISSH